MNIEEVLTLLEIDSPDEFEYFEHLAELIESAEQISYDAFYSVLREIEPKLLNELIDSYFEDALQGIPDEATDFYTMFLTIKQCLLGLSLSPEDSELRRQFIDELYRFRSWYTFDSQVHCISKKDGHQSHIPVVEALALYRLEKLGEERYNYDFSDSLDYQLEEYTFSFPYTVKNDDEAEGEYF